MNDAALYRQAGEIALVKAQTRLGIVFSPAGYRMNGRFYRWTEKPPERLLQMAGHCMIEALSTAMRK